MAILIRKHPAPRPTARRRFSRLRRREELYGFLFISPWLIGFVGLVVGPALFSLYMSLTRFRVSGASQFQGLANYAYAITRDPLFWSSLGRSGWYTALVVPLGVLGSFALALLLNQQLRWVGAFRTVFFVPSLVPIVATATLWGWILAPDIGPLQHALAFVGIHAPRWFAEERWAIPGVVLIVLWAGIGGGQMITFLAGLQGVPVELYEAASLDGAGRWARFAHVTFPMISPVIFFNVVLGVIGSFQVFDVAYVTTQGGPGYATYFYALDIYYTAFRDFDLGYAAALAWLLFLVILIFTQLQFRSAARWVHYEGEVKE
jgi:multiple sugar transport system permease protein